MKLHFACFVHFGGILRSKCQLAFVNHRATRRWKWYDTIGSHFKFLRDTTITKLASKLSTSCPASAKKLRLPIQPILTKNTCRFFSLVEFFSASTHTRVCFDCKKLRNEVIEVMAFETIAVVLRFSNFSYFNCPNFGLISRNKETPNRNPKRLIMLVVGIQSWNGETLKSFENFCKTYVWSYRDDLYQSRFKIVY